VVIITGIIYLYRAVGIDEYAKIIKTNKFEILEHGLQVKYFGLNYKETLDFADKTINKDLIAIFEILIKIKCLNNLGDFTNVDSVIFKNGTVEIQADRLDEFNKAIISILHYF